MKRTVELIEEHHEMLHWDKTFAQINNSTEETDNLVDSALEIWTCLVDLDATNCLSQCIYWDKHLFGHRGAPMREVFDALAWDDHLEWWKGTAEFGPGRRIDLHVEATNDPAALRAAVARAGPAWDRLRASELAVRAAVAGQLAAAHNEFCAPEDEVTESQFAERMRLLSVKFEAEGGAELVFVDRSLLGGHWIVVPVGPDGEVGEATTAG